MNRPGAYSLLATDPTPLPAAVKLIAAMIALVAPEEAARATRIQELVRREPTADSGLYESAALLAPLSSLSMPDAFALLADVPGCEKIAAILAREESKDEVVNAGVRALAKATKREERIAQGLPMDEVTEPVVEPTEDLPLPKLRVGMVCAEDLLSQSGSVIVPKNAVLQAVTLERLRRFATGAGVREPVRVFANAS